MLVVNPGDTWYGHLTSERVRQIVDQHLLNGRPLRDATVRGNTAG
jgi:(2Fe-2S) ferredoxin